MFGHVNVEKVDTYSLETCAGVAILHFSLVTEMKLYGREAIWNVCLATVCR